MRPGFLRRPADWAGVPVLVLMLVVSWVSHNSPPPTPLQTVFTPYLPINLVEQPSPHRVFAHYMPSLPISIDNKDGSQDYYATEYLAVDGEDGKHAAYGGFLRDRPLPRAHSDRPDWKLADLLTEISQAKSVGIDGFAVDVFTPRTESDVTDLILRAAAAVTDFTVMVTADVTGPFRAMTPAGFAAEIAPYLTAPAAFRLSDGRPVLGAFAAETRRPDWWRSVLDILHDKIKHEVAFVPTFLTISDNPEKFAAISYGFSMWGGRTPSAMATRDVGRGSAVDVIARTRRLGKLWMQPVAFQDSRPRDAIFQEPDNGLTNRMAWQLAEQQHAEWVQLVTWNDYAESTEMAPSVMHGWCILDMNAFDIVRFKYGTLPRVLRDAVFVSYRDQPVDARPVYHESSLMHVLPGSGHPRDTIEVVTFATASSEVAITAGAQHYSCRVPAGRGICTFPLSLGSFSAQMERGGEPVAVARSNADVTDRPRVQDLQYRVVGGLR
jgi:Glycosyl hydrolase family 71